MIDLESLKKEEHYEVPDGYFEHLPQQVMNVIHKKKTRTRNLWLTSAAAVMLAILCTTLIFYRVNENQEAAAKQAQKEMEDQQQLEEQMINYYSNELAQSDYYNY